MLERVDRDFALRDLGLVIARLALGLLVRPVGQLADEIDLFLADVVAVALAGRIQQFVEQAPADGSRRGVVDRHHPARDRDPAEELLALDLFPDGAGLVAVGQDDFGRSVPCQIAPAARLDVDHADRCRSIVDHLHLAPCFAKLCTGHPSVQKDGVDRILRVLVDLEPIARRGQRERHRVGIR